MSYVGNNRNYTTGPVKTFSAEPIGTPDPGRSVKVIVHLIAAAHLTSIALTIDGVDALLDKQSSQDIDDYTTASAIFSLSLPAGSDADIEITSNVDSYDCYIHVYAENDVGAAADTNSKNNYGGGGTGATYDLSVDAEPGTRIIASSISRQDSTLTPPVWTGATEDGSRGNEFDLTTSAASYSSGASETPHALTVGIVYEGGNRFSGIAVAYAPGAPPVDQPVIDDQTQIDIASYGAREFYSDGEGRLFTL